jgi:hypothetical protein
MLLFIMMTHFGTIVGIVQHSEASESERLCDH